MKKNPHAGSHVPILYCLKWILMVKFTLLLIVAFCYNSYAITSLAQGNVTLKKQKHQVQKSHPAYRETNRPAVYL